MIANSSLRTRLLAGYLLPIFAIILIGLTSIYISRIIQSQFEDITHNTVPTVRALDDAKAAGLRIVASANEFALLQHLAADEGGQNKDAGAKQEEVEQGAGFQQATDALAIYEKMVYEDNQAEEIALLEQLKQAKQTLFAHSDALATLVKNNATIQEILAAKHELEETEQAYLQTIEQALYYEADQELAERETDLDRTIMYTLLLIIGLTLATLLVVLIASFLIFRSIVDPLQKLRDAAHQIENGHFDVHVVNEANDELGQLANSFNQMASAVYAHAAKMAEQKKQLEQSNADLQQFAYVASHDLQEPLRMVSSYLQLLERRYKGKLDTDATEFIAFAVDGATRMKALIQALLAYSRVGTHGQPQKPVDCQQVLENTLTNLQLAIQENNARIISEHLPTVSADAIQLGQLFQNLIGNALKFRGERCPEIQVGAKRIEAAAETKAEHWQFWVRDNGIGIEPQYFERIFLIFQRLHTRDEYPGTGLGLAICKRIVERHGGQMWLESRIGEGTTFYFSLPAT